MSRFCEEWDLEEMVTVLRTFFPTTLTLGVFRRPTKIDAESLADQVVEDALKVYEAKEERFGAEAMRTLERWVLLRTIDSKWRDHLYEMDYLREGIGLRALAQIDPLVAYKNEGYKMFQELMESIQEDFVRYLYHLEIVQQEEPDDSRPSRSWPTRVEATPVSRRTSRPPGASRRARGRVPTARPKPTRPRSRPLAPSSHLVASPRSVATTPARAAAGRSTRSAAGREDPELGPTPGRRGALGGAMLRPRSGP